MILGEAKLEKTNTTSSPTHRAKAQLRRSNSSKGLVLVPTVTHHFNDETWFLHGAQQLDRDSPAAGLPSMAEGPVTVTLGSGGTLGHREEPGTADCWAQ